VGTWQASGVKAATINRRLGLLRRAYRLAKLRLDPARLDFADLFLPETSPRGRSLTPEAFSAISAHLPNYVPDLFEFAFLVGTRKGQLARTTWAHWNPETREFTWSASEVNAKLDFVLPLDGRPLELITGRHAHRRLHCRYVFHGPRCTPGRSSS